MVNFICNTDVVQIQSSTRSNMPTFKGMVLDSNFFLETGGKDRVVVGLQPRSIWREKTTPLNCSASNELFGVIKSYLSQNKDVKKILFLKKNDVLHIWTVLCQYEDEESRKAVYKQESALIKYLSHLNFHFDFYLIENNEVGEVMSSGAVVIYDKDIVDYGKNWTL